MNAYEEKQEGRRQRYLDRAEKKTEEYQQLHDIAHKMASVIPFGQPILVGHHSEQRDRNYRSKIHSKFGKAFEALETAKYYEDKAASVGKGGISSDDPDAIQKLQAELEGCEKLQETMKKVNAIIRKFKDRHDCLLALEGLGFTAGRAANLLEPDYMGRLGFPQFALTNNNANIRRIKARIEELQRAVARQPISIEYEGYTYKEEDNRCQFEFSGKPQEEIRAILKNYAFKWSPTRGAWVRMFNGNGRYAAECVMKKLAELAGK